MIRELHAHVYFDPSTRDRAESLRAKIAELFGLRIGRMYDRPIGPHTKGMFEVVLPTERFGDLVPWLMLNRDGLSVLVHPMTGDPIADHTVHALWLGEQLVIDVEVIRRYLARSHLKLAGAQLARARG